MAQGMTSGVLLVIVFAALAATGSLAAFRLARAAWLTSPRAPGAGAERSGSIAGPGPLREGRAGEAANA